jgi:BMFP domain-containing protein YqiC
VTQTQNRFFDEMAKLFNDAASVAQGVRREAESVFRTQMDRLVADLDLVRREDFEVVREMASKARTENEELKRRIGELEKAAGIATDKPAGITRKNAERGPD